MRNLLVNGHWTVNVVYTSRLHCLAFPSSSELFCARTCSKVIKYGFASGNPQINRATTSLADDRRPNSKKRAAPRRKKREKLTFAEKWNKVMGSSYHSTKAFDRFALEYFQILRKSPKEALQFETNLTRYIEELNKEWERIGYGVEKSADKIVTELWLLFISMIVGPILLILFFPMKHDVPEEHTKIMEEEETVIFSRFLKDYLSTRKVDSICCYPILKKAVAFLHSEAMINGKEFLGPGVHIELPDDAKPAQIYEQIRAHEKQLGITEEEGAKITMRGWISPVEKLKDQIRSYDTLLIYVFLAWFVRRRIIPVVKRPKLVLSAKEAANSQ